MELFLNLAGALIAVVIVCLWLRFGPRSGIRLGTQLVALALLILILFPMISMTDDLLAVQNAAETDVGLRVDHLYLSTASFAPVLMPDPFLVENHSIFRRDSESGTVAASASKPPALAPVENQPPPAA